MKAQHGRRTQAEGAGGPALRELNSKELGRNALTFAYTNLILVQLPFHKNLGLR